jgi:hypothetical protein
VLWRHVLRTVPLHFRVEVVYITPSKLAGWMFIYGYTCLLLDRTCKFCGTVTRLRGGCHPEESNQGERDFLSSKLSGPLVGPTQTSSSVEYLGLFPGVI